MLKIYFQTDILNITKELPGAEGATTGQNEKNEKESIQTLDN